jgi:hypothetical protein
MNKLIVYIIQYSMTLPFLMTIILPFRCDPRLYQSETLLLLIMSLYLSNSNVPALLLVAKVNSSCGLALQSADLHLLVGSWRLRGIAYIYVWLESSYDPPECHPGQWTACVNFPDSYPIDVSHLSFNFLCLLLLYCSVFISVVAPFTLTLIMCPLIM